MRRRLLVSSLGSVALALVLLGLPLALAVRGLLTGQALGALQQEAEQVQVLLNQQQLTVFDQRELLTRVAQETGIRFVLLDRVVLDQAGAFAVQIETPPPPELPDDLQADIARALRGEVGRVRAGGVLSVAVPVRTRGVSQVLRAVRSDANLRAQVNRAWLSIGVLGGAALLLAAALATWQAARLAKPLEALADTAAQLGEGDFSVRAPPTGMDETDRLALALERTADRLGMLVARTRSFGADASHQLRTPLTALRLDLEAIEVAGADPGLLRAAFEEADRLEATIDELLALAEAPREDEEVHLAALVEARVDVWRTLATAAGREVVVEAAPVPPVQARPAAIGQCLQVLLDNALEHGRGTITITVGPAAPRPEGPGPRWAGTGGERTTSHQWVRLCVQDEGDGLGEDAVPGRGLRLARSLVEAEGGRLAMDAGARVCLLLPAVHAATS